MSIGVLELNDAGLRFSLGDKQGIASPGYATLNGNDLLLGSDAMRQARLHPLQSNNQFWHRLSAEPLPMHNDRYRHHADLAYSQLITLYNQFTSNGSINCDEFVIALPGNFTREQMALLLGIIDQCPFKAVGLIDNAIASSALHAQPGNTIHVDAQLHQCVFTIMSVDQQINRQQVEVLPNAGLIHLRDRFAKSVADQFVEQSRFDPLHSAGTEQLIFDQLPQWLAQSFDQPDMILDVDGKTAKMSRNELVAPLTPQFRHIAELALKLLGGKGQILIGHQLASLPGFIDEFSAVCSSTSATSPTALSDSVLANSIEQNLDSIVKGEGNLAFIHSLPASANVQHSAATPSASSAVETNNPRKATHILCGNQAFPIGTTPLFILGGSELKISSQASRDTLGIIQAQGDAIALLPQGNVNLFCNNNPINDNKDLFSGDCVTASNLNGQLQFIEVLAEVKSDGP